MSKSLVKHLGDFVTEQRKELFYRIIKNRTKYVTVVLEDIFQPHNASAVLRTCDCFGIQDVHIIENRNKYQVNPDVALGADKWLSLKKYNSEEDNTLAAYNDLRSKGYRIVATTPHTNDVNVDKFDLSKGKVALIFGTELKGLSKTAIDAADEYLKIPMMGFTESFNISVSAAIILHFLTNKLHTSEKIQWKLSSDEKNDVLLRWFCKSIKESESIIERFNLKNIE